jgi:hypothetical protein
MNTGFQQGFYAYQDTNFTPASFEKCLDPDSFKMNDGIRNTAETGGGVAVLPTGLRSVDRQVYTRVERQN